MPVRSTISFELTSDEPRLVGEDGCLAEASARLPRGAYSTLRTYGGRGVVRFEAHLRRLEDSVALQGQRAAIDREAVRDLVRKALREGGHPESRLRLTFAPPRLLASVEAFVPPPRSGYEQGVACVTVSLHRDQPRVKDTVFIATATRAYGALAPGIEEGLLLGEDGSVLEGLSSNFFALMDDGLCTEGERVLAGITRALALEAARDLGPVVSRAVRLQELPRVREAFITSASREVLPVVRIDGAPVADGRVGPYTRRLIQAFDDLIRRETEPLD